MAEFFHPTIRLKTLAKEPGGISIAQALERAEVAVESIRGQTMAAIDAKIEEMVALIATQGAIDIQKIYRGADAIYGDAGAFNLPELARAAHSLCDFVTVKPAAATRPILKLFVDTMRALRNPVIDADPAAREAVLAGLTKIVVS
jgi:hypothetical protein